ncbi:MAG TPA: hypothetical protein VK194_03830 [Candidatus Deferrimicrobium sp.]|nr:hypothetical protein [Candidatus Deferrimicrobium sp.]
MDHLGHDTVEQLAALVLVVGGGILTVLTLRTRPVRPGPAAFAVVAPSIRPGAAGPSDAPVTTGAPSVRRSLVMIMAGLSAGAAVIHLVAAPSHYREIGDLAAGFLVSAAFQALWIRWLLAGPSRRTMAIGIIGNLAIIAAWAWTRTIGLPVGELAGSPEPVGYPDAASVAFELLLVAGLAVRRLDLDLAISRWPAARTIASIAVVPVVGLVLVLTSLATVAVATGLDHGVLDGRPTTEHVAGH